jgi:hypothetical protein
MAGIITFLRPRISAIIPTKGAAKATASVAEETVRLTASFEALKIWWNRGNNGCVEYKDRKAQKPTSPTAKTCLPLPGSALIPPVFPKVRDLI